MTLVERLNEWADEVSNASALVLPGDVYGGVAGRAEKATRLREAADRIAELERHVERLATIVEDDAEYRASLLRDVQGFSDKSDERKVRVRALEEALRDVLALPFAWGDHAEVVARARAVRDTTASAAQPAEGVSDEA